MGRSRYRAYGGLSHRSSLDGGGGFYFEGGSRTKAIFFRYRVLANIQGQKSAFFEINPISRCSGLS